MRFSLATLVLLVLWIGALMAVWVRREPVWIIQYSAPMNILVSAPCYDIGNRSVGISVTDEILITDSTNRKTLFSIHIKNYLNTAMFIDADTILFDYIGTDKQMTHGLLHRRFPEWWWGHFYRPEVWLAIGLSVLLIWRAARSRRAPVTQSSGLRVPATKQIHAIQRIALQSLHALLARHTDVAGALDWGADGGVGATRAVGARARTSYF